MESLQTQTDKRAAVTAQLRFRKNVLKQNVKDSCVYAMSKTVNGKCNKLSIQQLTDNVKTLVKGAILTDNQNHDGDTSSPIIVGKNIRHAQTVNNEKVWFSGKVISQVPGYPAWYNTKFVGDEAIYTYQLMEDYKQGDLSIVV